MLHQSRALVGLLTEIPPTVRTIRIVEHLWPASGRKELEQFERMRVRKHIVDPHRKELKYLGFRWYLVRDIDSVEEQYRFEMDDYGFLDNTNDSDVDMD